MASKSFLTLDIGANTLKMAEFVSSKNGELTLLNFGHHTMDLDSASDSDRGPMITEGVKQLISKRNFKARRVGISVSGQTVLTRFLRLPATDESRIRQMVQYEAAQNVPFPIEEVVWDFQIVGNKGSSDLDVMLIAIKGEIIEGFTRSVVNAGLDVVVVDVSPMATLNAALFNYDFGEECVLLLDIGARTTNLTFIDSKKFFTRSIPLAGNTITQSVAQEFEIPFTEAEQLKLEKGFVGLGGAYAEPEDETTAKLCKIIRNVMTRMHADVSRSINFYKTQQGGRSPTKLLLCGGTSITSYSDHFFKEKMEIDVEYFNPFKNVQFQVSQEELEKSAHSMGEAVGVALRLTAECPVEVNLLPPSVSNARHFKRQLPWLVMSMLGAMAMVLCWWIYHVRVASLVSKHRDELTKEVSYRESISEKMSAAQAEVKKVHQKAVQLEQVSNARYFWLQFFNQLNEVVPSTAWITQLTPLNGEKVVSYKGATVGTATTAKSGRGGRGGRGASLFDPMMGMPPGMEGGVETKVDATIDTKGGGITEFEIRGLCMNDRDSSEPLKPVYDFKANLSKSELFSDVKIMETSSPQPNDWTFSFLIRAKLKRSIAY